MKTIFLFLLLFFLSLNINSQTQIGADIDGEAAGDWSGNSVSLSSDGSIVAIGAYKSDPNGSDSGHVRIYQNISGTWTQVGADIDGESGSDWSGRSISLSSDGSIVAIGARQNDGNGMDAGHVRVYQNVFGTWTQIGSDIDGEAGFDRFGWSVSLSSDGTILAVGAPFNNGVEGSNTGHVRVYQNNAGSWVQIGIDIDGEAVNDQSGISVSLSSDGAFVAIGANNNDANGANSGHVRVYQNLPLGGWTQIGADIDGEASPDQFGLSISLSDDGSIVAVGAPFNDGNGSDSGHVRVYENIAGNWTQIGSDIDGELATDESGTEKSVSLSSDGNIVAIGAKLNDGNGAVSGHVRILQNISGTWTQIGSDIDGEATNDQSGGSVSLSSDGSVVAIGAEFNSGSDAGSGHVRVFDLSGLLSVDDFTLNNVIIYPIPVKDVFTIESKQIISTISIYNILGQKLSDYSGEDKFKLQIDMSAYEAGHYFAKIKTGEVIDTVRLLKK